MEQLIERQLDNAEQYKVPEGATREGVIAHMQEKLRMSYTDAVLFADNFMAMRASGNRLEHYKATARDPTSWDLAAAKARRLKKLGW